MMLRGDDEGSAAKVALLLAHPGRLPAPFTVKTRTHTSLCIFMTFPVYRSRANR